MKKNYIFSVALCALASTAVAQQLPEVSAAWIAEQQAQVMTLDHSQAAVAAGELAEATPAEKAAFAARYKAHKAEGAMSVAYARPMGVFYAGVSQKTALKTCPPLVAPPFRTVTYRNISQNVPENTAWEWQNIVMNYLGGDDTLYSADRELRQYNLVNYNRAPRLSAINGTDTTSYIFHSKWGSTLYNSTLIAAPNPGTLLGLAGNYGSWYSSSKYFGYYDREGKYSQAIIHYAVAGDASTSSWFGTNKLGNTNACGAAFEKPEHPYVLTKVNILFANARFTDSVLLHCRVYRLKDIPDTANAVPTTLDLIAKGSTWLTEKSIQYQDGRWGTLEFDLKNTYEGIDYGVTPDIDYPILVVVGGYNDPKMTQFNLFVSRDNLDEGLGELGYLCNIDENGDLVDARGFLGNWKTLELHSAPSIFIQTMHTYMKVYVDEENGENTEEDLIFNANADGDSKTVDVYSYLQSQGLWQVFPLNSEEMPDWVHIAYSDRMTGADGSAYAGHTDVTFDVDPLPSGMQSREARLMFAYPGARLNYTIRQVATSAIDEVEVSAQDDENAPVYNMMGQRVGRDAKGLLIKGGKKIFVK